ncbi:MAG: lysylphosphatidylglycerol synthase transmembrane domain-containing protein [Anaerolineales bacterium]|jgi:hypothetical protein
MIRKIVYTIIIGLTIFFVVRNHDELVIIINTLARANPGWLMAAVGAQLLWIVTIAGNLQSTYNLTGMRETLRRMIVLATAGNFINVVAPSYGFGAMAVFIADGQQRGKPAGKITTASFLYLVYDYFGFMIMLTIGFFLLERRGLLGTALIGAAIFACSIGVSLIIAAIVGIFSSDHLDRLVVWFVRGINRILKPFIRRALIDLDDARGFGIDLANGLKEIRRSPGNLLQPIGWALGRKTMMMVILYLVSLAYGSAFDLPTVIVSFAVSYLFTIASVTPSGVGFVEGAMSLIQVSMGIDPAKSVAIAIAYRGLTFWLILLYGFFAIRAIDYQAVEDDPEAGESDSQ